MVLTADVNGNGFAVPIGVLVAEPADPRPHRVCEAVRLDPRFELVACVPDAASSIARALEVEPEVIVLDAALPQGALAAAWEIRARLPETHLLVLHDDADDDLLHAVSAGASAYLARTAETEQLLEAIAEVGRGEIVLSRPQIARLVEAVRDPTRPRRTVAGGPKLTAREWQILDLRRSGRTMPEIAAELYLSPITVRSHARSTRRKLRAADSSALKDALLQEVRSSMYR